jgi:hypothetical protein
MLGNIKRPDDATIELIKRSGRLNGVSAHVFQLCIVFHVILVPHFVIVTTKDFVKQ